MEEWATLGRLDPCSLLGEALAPADATLTAPDPHSCTARGGDFETQLQVGAGFDADERAMALSDPKVTTTSTQGISVFQAMTRSSSSCTSTIPVGERLGVRIVSGRGCAETTEVTTNIVKILLAGAGEAMRDGNDPDSHTACELMGEPEAPDAEVTAEAGDSGSACSLMTSTPPTRELFASLSMAYDDAWLDVTQDPDLGVAEKVDGRDVVYTTLTGTCEGRVRIDASTQPESSHDWLVATLRSSDCERLKKLMPTVVAAWQAPPPEGVDLTTLLDVG